MTLSIVYWKMENRDFVKTSGHRFVGVKRRSQNYCASGYSGNDLGSYMDGPLIESWGIPGWNRNTMNNGTIIVHGHAGDIVGHSMREVIYKR